MKENSTNSKKKPTNLQTKYKSNESITKSFSSFIVKNFQIISRCIITTVVIVIIYVIYSSMTSQIKNLQNVDVETLKSLFLGEDPAVYYCHRGGKSEFIPSVFTDLHKAMGSQVNFALLNCSQTLPSGKTIWDRFKVKKEWRPSVFVTSPWGLPKQIAPSNMKDLKIFKKTVQDALAARLVEVTSDKTFSRDCSSAASPDNSTCIVVLKGAKFSSSHTAIIENIVKQFPKLKKVEIDSKSHRLSFENTEKLPYDSFAMKIYAIRKGGYYLNMESPANWENIESFVSSSLKLSLDDFSGYGDIKVIAAPSKSFKKRYTPPPPNPTPPEEKENKNFQSETTKVRTF